MILTAITYSQPDRLLRAEWDDGVWYDLPAELLRVESPSAEVQGHGPGQKVTVTGKEMVAITAIEPIGHYAVRLVFDDGHNTGYYTFRYLRELGAKHTKSAA